MYPVVGAARARSVGELAEAVVRCTACPRLVAWREEVARVKRAAFRDQEYWGRPVPGFGPADAAVLVVGLAPAAHGGNRTGRMFTGDPSGDVLFPALHAVGLADRPDARELLGARVTAPVHCAPPGNRPTTGERDTCRPWLVRELELLRPTLRVAVALGGFAWQALLPALDSAGWRPPRPRPVFGHGAEAAVEHADGGPELRLLGCYHPSRRNTSTGRLTPAMLREVLRRAARLGGR
ncbi:uracil-DNA glycosylase [Streptomyces litchfieldiae]|uniref:Type-5 uracil-DNA glycosylase n=1 Tax=Streptomyces litchfieldiae TaxID=3075543 RepID=A0ABU2MKX0_9ACTN|nr:uracil-DNA glycosylase [Streptomyces sp. DSM 44938]MDT0342028.1 uracil-DNA glycosylase [Streptomyces sp. DSM 44938]